MEAKVCHLCRCDSTEDNRCNVGLDARCRGCYLGTHSFMICQTRRQRHCNFMLYMRRTMKAIAQVMRIEVWMMWMDYDDPVGKEPELEDGDVEAFLYASGSTKKSLKEFQSRIMKIVEDAKKKYRDGD